VWLALQGHWTAAIGLTIWGVAVVGLLDNVVKMYVLQSEADLHPLIAFISVIGALQVMGLWGVFIGPIVASCLFALVQIFNTELKEMARDREAQPTPPQPIPATAGAGNPSVIAVVASQPEPAPKPVAAAKSHRKRRR
jgi:predicted PurR-regulated permease PerM